MASTSLGLRRNAKLVLWGGPLSRFGSGKLGHARKLSVREAQANTNYVRITK